MKSQFVCVYCGRVINQEDTEEHYFKCQDNDIWGYSFDMIDQTIKLQFSHNVIVRAANFPWKQGDLNV